MPLSMFLGDLLGMNRGRGKVRGLQPPEDSPFFLEQFKALRAKIDDHFEKDGSKMLAVTSAVAEEGKSITCVNLATSLATTGRKKVLLVDADMHKTGLANGLNLKKVPGLSEFLSDGAELKEILRNTHVPRLFAIPPGSKPSSPADMIAGEKFRSLLQSARENFDIVILDTPPVLPVADTLSLREQVDWFVLVYRARFTPYPLLKKVVSDIGEEKILGVVINRVRLTEDRYYTRYYGSYYTK